MRIYPRSFLVLARVAACCAAGLTLAGCNKEEPVRAYSAPKEVAVRVASSQPGADAGESSTAGGLTWTAPAGWKELPAGEMRKAAFAISPEHPDAVVTVVPLGAEAGGLAANVARWQGQLGLPASPPAEVDKLVTHADINGLHVDRVDLLGPETPPAPGKPRQRMMAAIIPAGGQTWFFKLMAPAEVAEAQKANFDAFVNSIRPAGGEGPAPAVTAGADARTVAPPPPSSPGSVAAAAPGKLTWGALPAGWSALPAPQPPRVATFKVEDSGQQAELVVTKFPGTAVGSFGDNVNRWRGQLGLAPAADTSDYAPKMLTLGGEQWAVVEVAGEDKPGAPGSAQRILVGMATPGGQAAREIWFFKLQGPSKLVESQRAAFEKFLESVKFGAE